MNNYSYQLPNGFPNQLLNNGYSLESIGVNEIAWDYKNAIDVINFLTNKGMLILGGDVYSKKGFKFEATCDNWYINRSTSQNLVEESREKAIRYISEYSANNGDQYVYSIISER